MRQGGSPCTAAVGEAGRQALEWDLHWRGPTVASEDLRGAAVPASRLNRCSHPLPAPNPRCVLDAMFDDRFRLKPAFLHNEAALRRRLRCVGRWLRGLVAGAPASNKRCRPPPVVLGTAPWGFWSWPCTTPVHSHHCTHPPTCSVLAAVNLAAAPFLLVFLAIYFFMKVLGMGRAARSGSCVGCVADRRQGCGAPPLAATPRRRSSHRKPARSALCRKPSVAHRAPSHPRRTRRSFTTTPPPWARAAGRRWRSGASGAGGAGGLRQQRRRRHSTPCCSAPRRALHSQRCAPVLAACRPARSRTPLPALPTQPPPPPQGVQRAAALHQAPPGRQPPRGRGLHPPVPLADSEVGSELPVKWLQC